MKKKLLLLFPTFLGLVLSGCGNDPSEPDKGKGEPDTEEKEKEEGGEQDPPIVNQYTITFNDEEGNLLDEKLWDEGTTPSYNYSKDDTEEWDYTFEGWSLTLGGEVITVPSVSEDATYYAVVSQTKQQYKITFYDENSQEISSNFVEYGVQPFCDYTGPSDTAEWDHTFLGWSISEHGNVLAELPVVSGEASYYAQVESTKQSYSIKFCENNGNVLLDTSLPYGSTPYYNYQTGTSDEWVYTFEGWAANPNGDPLESMPRVTGDATYYAQVSKVKRTYAITFYDEYENEISSSQFEYGTRPSCDYAGPEDTAEYGYTFRGWGESTHDSPMSELPLVTGEASYYAIVGSQIKSYKIHFMDENSNELTVKTYQYGEKPTYYYAGPSDTDEWNYTFKGWSATLGGDAFVNGCPNVTGEAYYYAVISQVKCKYSILFMDENGHDLQNTPYEYGAIPSCSYTGPEDTVQFDYTLEGWRERWTQEVYTGELPTVTFSTWYTAVVSKVTRTYPIHFMDENGNLIETKVYGYGELPTCDYQGPEDTTTIDYYRKGWATTLGGSSTTYPATVTGEATYYADITTRTRLYEINFYDHNGDYINGFGYEYNEIPSYAYYAPADTGDIDYVFEGWSSELNSDSWYKTLPAVTEDADYYAIVKSYNFYNLYCNAGDGSPSTTIRQSTRWGINQPENPTLSGYHFTHWSYNQDGTNPVTWPVYLTGNTTIYANYEENLDLKGYFSSLYEALVHDPYSYIPNSMRPKHVTKVSQSDVTYDFSDFVDVDDIKYGGFGEQWHMIIENIKQSELFYNITTYGSDVLALASAAVLSELDNYEGTSTYHKIWMQPKYRATFDFADNVINYYLYLHTAINVPLLGNLTPHLDFQYDLNTFTKTVRIELNENNVIKFEITGNSYKFAMEYGVGGVARKAYFEVEKDQDDVAIGHIYEFITNSDKELIKSCADFYIDDNYVSAVGNKANAIPGFDGIINELYLKETGKLLGYKVQETFTKWGFSKTYNTLWFNLCDIANINSVKAIGNGSVDPHENNHDIYLNGSETLFEPDKNAKLMVKTSRKYDVEMRTQYFYGNQDDEIIEFECLIPMMFIQDDGTESGETNYSTFESDILSKNGINAGVTLLETYLTKIREDYLELIPDFKENKELINSDYITEFIGDAFPF